ncbi:MAG: hypothetical protein REI09_05365 [Candidatus Dactylopiibacterium sp.]|nr:hypothetical protein [Candidatus Dactylopiibacterium sp.]
MLATLLSFLKKLVARRELEELSRWHIQWQEHRRRLASIPNVGETLDHLRDAVRTGGEIPLSAFRDALRRQGAQESLQERALREQIVELVRAKDHYKHIAHMAAENSEILASMAWPGGLLDRVKAAEQRIANNLAPRRIPADPADVDLVLAEVRMLLEKQPPPIWLRERPHDPATTRAAHGVLVERLRQIEVEGYTPEHDDEHANEELAAMACFYAMPPGMRDWPATETGYGATFGSAAVPEGWQTQTGNRLDELHKAGALILAEIARQHRSAAAPFERKHKPHRWDKSGERCMDCGDKDWLADADCRGTARATDGGAE